MKDIIVIGAGPVGVKAASELLKRTSDVTIKLFNGEPSRPYNRAQLSYFLAGDLDLQAIDNSLFVEDKRLQQFENCRIKTLQTQDKVVIDQHGNSHQYDKLILATGSLVNSPSVLGDDKSGVYRFRSLSDAHDLLERRSQNHNVYVVGSGPLGIETALAMKTQSNQVYLQVRRNLFARDLDENAKSVLMDYIRSNGVKIVDSALLEKIRGNGKVSAVTLTGGEELSIDSVVMCTGISPFKELAVASGIETNQGILVDDFMRTNCDDVYAVGECAEHQGVTHGLISPGYEQAEACVSHILDEPKPFSGKQGELQFKFRSFSSHIMGDVSGDSSEVVVYKNTLKNTYRKLYLQGRKIVGAVLVGEWSESGRIAGAISGSEKLPYNGRARFLKSGNVWSDDEVSILDQPEDYIVCLCKGVTRGEISTCIEKGHRTLTALGEQLEAGVTCGSCQPLLKTMVNEPVAHLIMRHYKSILWASVISIIVIFLTFLAPKLPFERSVQFGFQFEKIWYGSIYKQTTGYVLLGLVFLSCALSFRKRWKKLKLGNLDDWRYVHTILGLIALFALIVHTGFRLGEGLSFVLMVVFLLATLTGSLVGVFMSRNHHWTDIKLTQYRAWWSRVHYGLLWLLPALLAFHILGSYYFA